MKSYIHKKFIFLFVLLTVFYFGAFFIPIEVKAAAVLTRPPNNLSLKAYWSFDDGAGTSLSDLSGNGFNGTLTNGPVWAQGKRGKALEFDGTPASGGDDVVTLGTTAILTGRESEYTFCAWIYNDVVPNDGADGNYIYSRETGPSSPDGALNLFYAQATGIPYIGINTSSGGSWDVNGVDKTLPTSTWVYLCYVHASDDEVTFYFDGIPDATTQTVGDPQNVSSLPQTIGGTWNDASPTGSWNGKIDDVRIWHRALTGTEILMLYRNGQVTRRQVSNLSLKAYWSFDDGVGTSLSDLSGNDFNGTLTNFALSGTNSNWLQGKRGKALDFDGTSNNGGDDIVLLGTTDILTGRETAWTLCAWVNPDAAPNSNNYYQIYVRQTTSSQTGSFLMEYKNVSSVYSWDVATHNGSWNNHTANTATIPTGQYTHLCASRNGSNVDLYYNGVADGSVAYTQPSSASGLMQSIGSAYNNGGTPLEVWNGKIDEVKIWHRTLTSAEIGNLYLIGNATLNVN